MTWFVHLEAIAAAFTVGYLPIIVLSLVNWCIRIVWWYRIGRLTTWKGVRKIIADQTNNHELLIKTISIGFTSFGTYTTIGGWPSFLLRNKENGMTWVVIGEEPNDLEEYGIGLIVTK
jgi:hypothetical protein